MATGSSIPAEVNGIASCGKQAPPESHESIQRATHSLAMMPQKGSVESLILQHIIKLT
jgi:hypothetical protein